MLDLQRMLREIYFLEKTLIKKEEDENKSIIWNVGYTTKNTLQHFDDVELYFITSFISYCWM